MICLVITKFSNRLYTLHFTAKTASTRSVRAGAPLEPAALYSFCCKLANLTRIGRREWPNCETESAESSRLE